MAGCERDAQDCPENREQRRPGGIRRFDSRRHGIHCILGVGQTRNPQRSWNFAVLGCVSLIALGYHSFWLVVKYRGYEHLAVWYEAQAWAGVTFVVIVFVRMLAAGITDERNSGWKIYVALTLLSPFWIRGLFALALRIRDGYVG
jgi:hypothetical protein